MVVFSENKNPNVLPSGSNSKPNVFGFKSLISSKSLSSSLKTVLLKDRLQDSRLRDEPRFEKTKTVVLLENVINGIMQSLDYVILQSKVRTGDGQNVSSGKVDGDHNKLVLTDKGPSERDGAEGMDASSS